MAYKSFFRSNIRIKFFSRNGSNPYVKDANPENWSLSFYLPHQTAIVDFTSKIVCIQFLSVNINYSVQQIYDAFNGKRNVQLITNIRDEGNTRYTSYTLDWPVYAFILTLTRLVKAIFFNVIPTVLPIFQISPEMCSKICLTLLTIVLSQHCTYSL